MTLQSTNIFLQNNGVSRLRNEAESFISESLQESEDKPIHAFDQARYIDWNAPTLENVDLSLPVSRFLAYKLGPDMVDNDTSMLVTVARYNQHNTLLDPLTLERQYRQDDEQVLIYKKLFEISSFEADEPVSLEGMFDLAAGDKVPFRGDTLTSPWTPLKTYVNRIIGKGSLTKAESRLKDLFGGKIKGVRSAAQVWSESAPAVSETLDEILSDRAKSFIDMSDTLANFIICPLLCNAERVAKNAVNDTVDYYLAHIYMFFQSGWDVRYLNRLFAASPVRRVYPKYDSIEDVSGEVNKSTASFIRMLVIAGIVTWEDFVNEMRVRAFCDDDLIPLDMRTGCAMRWDGQRHLDVMTASIKEDEARFEILTDCLALRNVDVNEKLYEQLV